MNNYYVYEWIRMDTKEPFYVGKGKENRAYQIKKNKYFNDILNYCEKNNIKVLVSILNDNLTEKEAYDLECWYINEYIFNYGYSLTNTTWGGEGGNTFHFLSEEEKKIYKQNMSKKLKGKNTGPRSMETCLKISKTRIEKGLSSGKNNPMYGKNYTDYMSLEKLEQYKINLSKSLKGTGTKKTVAILHNKELFFDTREECFIYFKNNYGLTHWQFSNIIKSKEPYNPKRNKYSNLKGLIIKFI